MGAGGNRRQQCGHRLDCSTGPLEGSLWKVGSRFGGWRHRWYRYRERIFVPLRLATRCCAARGHFPGRLRRAGVLRGDSDYVFPRWRGQFFGLRRCVPRQEGTEGSGISTGRSRSRSHSRSRSGSDSGTRCALASRTLDKRTWCHNGRDSRHRCGHRECYRYRHHGLRNRSSCCTLRVRLSAMFGLRERKLRVTWSPSTRATR